MKSAKMDKGMVRDSPTQQRVGFRSMTLRAQSKSDSTVPNKAYKIRNPASIPVGS